MIIKKISPCSSICWLTWAYPFRPCINNIETYDDGGIHFLDFNIDADFGDCIDGLVLADIHMLKAKKKARYMPHDAVKKEKGAPKSEGKAEKIKLKKAS